MPDPHLFIAFVLSRVETGTATFTPPISNGRPAGNSNYGNDQNKLLGLNSVQIIIKLELLMCKQIKEVLFEINFVGQPWIPLKDSGAN